jgi:anti-anti-sigma factor
VAAVPSIEIEIQTCEACIVTLHGEHDVASSEGVALALALARDYAHVLVDLTPCTFLDGAVINALLVSARRMRAAEGALELIAPNDVRGVRRTLALAGVLPLLPIHATRSEGLVAITTAERVRAHGRSFSFRAVSAEIDHLEGETEASRAIGASEVRGHTVLRAQVEDSALESEQAARRRSA